MTRNEYYRAWRVIRHAVRDWARFRGGRCGNPVEVCVRSSHGRFAICVQTYGIGGLVFVGEASDSRDAARVLRVLGHVIDWCDGEYFGQN